MLIETSACVDWLEWTYHEGRDRSIWLRDALRYWDPSIARNGYTDALKDPSTGMVLMWHRDVRVHERMGYHFVATGDTMAKLRAQISEPLILASIGLEGGDDLRITRIDLALDVYNAQMRPGDIKACAEHGIIKPRSKVRYWTVRTYPNGSQAQSYQIGNKNTKHFLAYDKGMEMGDFETDRLRLEIRYRQKHGMSAFEALTSGQGLHRAIRGMIKDELRPRDDELDFILDAPPVKIAQEVRDRGFDTLYHWLDTTALPALKRAEGMRDGTACELMRKHGLYPCNDV